MSNLAEKKEVTQELIKETAKKLFFVEGKFDATTQEIADAAAVNRTLINYYFRSRDNLMQIVFEEAKSLEIKKSIVISQSSLPFREKVAMYIENSLYWSVRYPYLETYIVMQINKGCFGNEDGIDQGMLNVFFADIESEMEKGNIEKMEPVQFLLNLASLLMFPTTMRPLLMKKLRIDKDAFDELLAQRKEIIMHLLFKEK